MPQQRAWLSRRSRPGISVQDIDGWFADTVRSLLARRMVGQDHIEGAGNPYVVRRFRAVLEAIQRCPTSPSSDQS